MAEPALRANVEAVHPLTPVQEGMLFHALYAESSCVYFEQLTLTLGGPLDTDALERAWQHIVDRHPILRTVFVWKKQKRPLQVVRGSTPIDWRREDWSDRTPEQRAAELEAFLTADRAEGFDVSARPPLRLVLIHLGDHRHHLIWSFHHLLLDGWSVAIVLSEVLAAYDALAQGHEPQLPPVRPFQDYVEWLGGRDGSASESFWREYFDGFDSPIRLPRSADPAYGGDGSDAFQEHVLWLPRPLTERLAALARRQRVTLSTLVQAAWGLLLSRRSGENDIVFGAAFSGRTPELLGIEAMVGMFLGTMPVRVRCEPDQPFTELLAELQSTQLELQQHQHTPLVNIQRATSIPQGTPLFDTLVVFENYPVGSLTDHRAGRLEIVDARLWSHTNYALHLRVQPLAQLGLSLTCDRSSFDRDSGIEILAQLTTLLENVASHPERHLSELSVLTDEKRLRRHASVPHLAPRPGSREPSSEELDISMPAFFERQVERHAERVAVIGSDGTEWTYARLDEDANRIASALRRGGSGGSGGSGVAPERVALLLRHGPAMIAGLLGALKAGASYVPLDPIAPDARLDWMLEDSGASHLLADVDGLSRARRLGVGGGGRVVPVSLEEALASGHAEASTPAIPPESLAYILYTSGSTGRPKGVMQSHRNALHQLGNYRNLLGIGPDDRLSLFASLAFDAALMDIWAALMSGAALVPVDLRETGPEAALRRLQEAHVTIYHSTPTVFRHLLGAADGERYPEVRVVVLGGEPADGADAERFRRHFGPDCALINELGCTESTLGVWHVVSPDEAVAGRRLPIGRAVQDTEIVLLDPEGRVVELCGEIGIRSRYIALGYWQRPELTAAAFLPDPGGGERRIYRTGDVARVLADGNLESVGRRGDRVKVRGFRVEPREIEAELFRHPAVVAAFVHPWGEGASLRLAAYVVLRESPGPDPRELRRHLASRLPAYMVPSAIVVLDALPLTITRKVDRSALPEPDWSRSASGSVGGSSEPPRTTLEQQIAEIWSEVLGGVRPGAHDSFFDLGGHSLNATRVLSRMRERLGADVSLRRLFDSPTVAGLAAATEEALARREDAPARAPAPALAIPRAPQRRLSAVGGALRDDESE